MVKVKICGITNLKDALDAAKAGCDAVGFLFYKNSPRYISPAKAKGIIRRLPKAVKKIGVFVNENEKRIKAVARDLRLDVLQFHGNESPEFCARFKGYKIIKVFRVKDKKSLKDIRKYSVWAFLFDTYQRKSFGGTGRRFNWELLQEVTPHCKNIFLSGGLNAANVKDAIKATRPDWVDASSSLEARPGRKDARRVRDFIVNAKGKQAR